MRVPWNRRLRLCGLARKSNGSDQVALDIARRMNLLSCDEIVTVMLEGVLTRAGIVQCNHAARLQPGRVALISSPRPGGRLIAVENEQIDRRRPLRSDLLGKALVHLDPVGDAGCAHVPVEMLTRRERPKSHDDGVVMRDG